MTAESNARTIQVILFPEYWEEGECTTLEHTDCILEAVIRDLKEEGAGPIEIETLEQVLARLERVSELLGVKEKCSSSAF